MTVASAILIMYYGSWELKDSAVHGPTIGTSFVRYWLPMTVGVMPFFGITVERFLLRRGVIIHVAAVAILIVGAMTAIMLPVEGLRATRAITREAAAVGAAIIARTEPNAIILTEQADKILFPERRIIVNDPADRAKIETSLTVISRLFAPVYYVTVLTGVDIDHVNKRISEYGISWTQPEKFGDYWLYTLQSI